MRPIALIVLMASSSFADECFVKSHQTQKQSVNKLRVVNNLIMPKQVEPLTINLKSRSAKRGRHAAMPQRAQPALRPFEFQNNFENSTQKIFASRAEAFVAASAARVENHMAPFITNNVVIRTTESSKSDSEELDVRTIYQDSGEVKIIRKK